MPKVKSAPAPSAPAPVADAAPAPVADPSQIASAIPLPKADPPNPADLSPMDRLSSDPTEEEFAAALAEQQALEAGEAPASAPATDPAPAPAADDPAAPANVALDSAGAAYPEWVEEKYRTGRTVAQAVEAQAKGYAEAQKSLRSRAADLRVKPGEAPKPAAAPELFKELDGPTMRAIGVEFMEKGDLSKETYEKIQANFKIPPARAKAMVEAEIQARGAQAMQIIEDAGMDLAAFESARAWASTGLQPAVLDQINVMLDGSDEVPATPVTQAAAVRMIRDLHAKANPPPPKPRLAGTPGGEAALKPILSQAEYIRELEAIDDKWGQNPERMEKEMATLTARARAGNLRV